jgi:hypothetical protein
LFTEHDGFLSVNVQFFVFSKLLAITLVVFLKMKVNCLLLASLVANGAAFQAASVNVRSLSRIFTPAPLAAYLEIGEGTERDVGAMDEWATMCEVQRCDGFQLTTEDGMDFSALATQDIAEGSPILCVPGNMIISSSVVREELGEGASPAVDHLSRVGAGEQTSEFFLFLKIIAEYEQGDQSPYFPWLNSLPRLFFNAVSMTGKTFSADNCLIFFLDIALVILIISYF